MLQVNIDVDVGALLTQINVEFAPSTHDHVEVRLLIIDHCLQVALNARALHQQLNAWTW